jgi:hypothetical protein
MADQTQRLEVATVRAEIGSSILYRFSNDDVDDGAIPTESGDITNLKKVILDIQTEGANKISFATSIYPTVAAGLAASTDGGIFLVRSDDPDEIYAVYANQGGAAVDTGKRALSGTAVTEAVDSATQAADAAQLAANTATERVAGFHSPAATDPTTRDDGSALQIGDTYFNTTTQSGRTYSSTGWILSSVNGNDLDAAIATREPVIAPGAAGTYFDGTKTFRTLNKAAVGLNNVNNIPDSMKPVSGPQQAALDLKANLDSPTFTGPVGGITKSMVGLPNVDNTSDANKPVSTATQAALDAKLSNTYGTTTITARLGEVGTPMQYGAAGNGIADDTQAFKDCIAANKGMALRGGKTYRITSTILVPSGFSIIGDGSCTVVMDGAGFNYTAYAHATGSGFRTNAAVGNRFEGFKIRTMNWTADLSSGAFGIQSSSNVKVDKVDITGFTKSSIVKFDSCFNCGITRSEIHDCLLASTTSGQLTGVDIDNNRVNEISSQACFVEDNRIYNLTVSAAFLASFGYQTDGVNVSFQASTEHSICRNRISNVGEGVDCFGSQCNISENVMFDIYAFGVKLVHAARRNQVALNSLSRCGYSGIVLAGNAADLNHTEKNNIFGNIIMFSGLTSASNSPSESPWAANGTAGIRLENETLLPVGQRYFCRQNFIHDNFILENGGAKYGIYEADDSDQNEYLNNLVDGYSIYEFLSTVALASQSFRYSSARKSQVKATASAALTVTNIASTTIFNQEIMDTNGEYDPATGVFTAKAPRTLRVSSSLESTTSVGVGDQWTANIVKTTLAGVTTTERTRRVAATTNAFVQSDVVLDVIRLNTGDKISRTSMNGAGNRTANPGIASAYLEISEVS